MIRVNLLKPEAKKIKEGPPVPITEVKEKKAPPIANIVLVLVIVGLAGLLFLQKRSLDQERQRLSAAQEEKNKLSYVIEKLDQLQQQKASYEKKISLINALKIQQPTAVILLDEVSKCLPDWVWLTEVSYENRQLRLKGNALSNNLIADFIRNLEDSPYLENVNLLSSAQRGSAEQTFLEFSMTLQFVLPSPPTPPANPQAAQNTQKEKSP